MARNMRRLIGLLCVILLIGLGSVYAAETSNVIDKLDYLTEGELEDLQQDIDDINENWQLEAVIVITDNTEGKSSGEYATAYFDNNGYGVGDDSSGVLLLVNMDERELWISPAGAAIDIFSDKRISDMVDEITPYLSDEKYDEACQTFLDLVDRNAEKGKITYLDKLLSMMSNFIVYIVALLVAIITVVVLTLSRKGKVTINNLTYEEKGSFILTNQQDDYLREIVTKTKIETSSGGGGKSRGGGGKF